MRLPQLKRRRLLSNPPVPFLTPTLLVASLKPSGISTCTSCHRTIKPSPPLTCARCNASTCAICIRTCSGGPLPGSGGTGISNPSPHQWPSPPPLDNLNAPSPSPRRRPRDEDIDTIVTAKDSEREGNSCGRMICRICCLEVLQSETVTCLDCFAAPRALLAHVSDASMHEAIADTLTAST